MAGRRSKLTLFRLGNPLSSTSWILGKTVASISVFPESTCTHSGAAHIPAGSRMFVNSRWDSLPYFGDSQLSLKFSSCSFQWSFRLVPVTTPILGSDFSPGRCGWWKGVKTQILWMFYPWDPHTPLQHLSPKVCSQGDQEVVGSLS